MEAITAPLSAVRQLYAARPAGAEGGDYGVRERFAALASDPAWASQASGSV
jgi:hypothetical protein